jgi:UDP-N-acetylmuramoyl-tripeptide--D-alanyl-D-alanine ligase
VTPGPLESWGAFADIAGGRWVLTPGDALPTGASIDTRSLARGDVFFALRGERADGHAFVDAAFDAGASVAVVERPPSSAAGGGVLVVPDVQRAMWKLALAHRETLRRRGTAVIGVTGSNGKTTTVRLIEAALGSSAPGRRSVKSFNNHLGVPLTILSAREGDRWLACEIGTSGPGEIARLTALASPEIAVVTSIGRAHIERLGSVGGVAREKASILTSGEPAALVGIVCAESPELEPWLTDLEGVVRVGGGKNAKIRVLNAEPNEAGQAVTLETPIGRRRFAIPFAGAHNAHNAACAWAVGLAMAFDADAVEAGLATARGAAMRLEHAEVAVPGGTVSLINDAYNANPESVLAALDHLRTLPGRRVAVLGDMLELGELSEASHAEIIGRALEAADVVVAVGGRMSSAVGDNRAVHRFTSADDPGIVGLIGAGDAVLLKGSRGVGLERVAAALTDRA